MRPSRSHAANLLLTATICLACVAPRQVRAVELTLDEVIERALQHGHEVQISQTSLDTVDARLRRSQALLPTNPYVSGGFWDTTATRFIDDRQRGIGPSYTLSLSQTFEIAGQRGQRVALAASGVDVAEANALAARSTLIANVRRTFHDAIEADARVGFAAETLHWHRELRRAYERSGEAARNQAQIRIARAESDHEASKHALFLLESRLRHLLRLPDEEPLVLVGELAEVIVALPPVEEMTAFARAHRADLAAYRSAVAGEDAALGLARRRVVPDITVSGFVSRSETSGSDLQFGASVGLALPVFRGGGPDIDEAVAARTRAQAELSNIESLIAREVRDARYACLVAGIDVERIRTEVLPRAEENLRLAERDFDAGNAGVWELVTAELDRVHARREHTSALRIYNNALIEVERVLGASLDQFTPPNAADAPASEDDDAPAESR